tara:strand:- start:49198 stop:49626 length:429 start_codon:yes stop_codon:yes gene_type:complete
MATYTKYETYVEHLSNSTIDAFGTTDLFKAAITTDAPVVATDDALVNTTQIAGNNGYTTGGDDIQNDSTRTGLTITFTAVDVVWTATTGNLGTSTTGRYFVIHDDTSITDKLMCYFDYGGTFTVAVGETMTLDFGASLYTLT